MASGAIKKISGSFVGSGSAQDVHVVGFRPKHVKLVNVDGLATLEWFDTMPDDAGLKAVTAGTLSYLTSNGITPLADGFTLGADADMNVSGEVVHFVATE